MWGLNWKNNFCRLCQIPQSKNLTLAQSTQRITRGGKRSTIRDKAWQHCGLFLGKSSLTFHNYFVHMHSLVSTTRLSATRQMVAQNNNQRICSLNYRKLLPVDCGEGPNLETSSYISHSQLTLSDPHYGTHPAQSLFGL
jgi:hypothetical protein